MVLWFSSQAFHPLVKRILVSTAVLVSIGFLLIRIQPIFSVNEYIQDYLSITEVIDSNSVILPVRADLLGPRINPGSGMQGMQADLFLHTSGYISAKKKCVNLHNYEATKGYFPVRFRPFADPAEHLRTRDEHSFETPNPSVAFLDYQKKTGVRIDYLASVGI